MPAPQASPRVEPERVLPPWGLAEEELPQLWPQCRHVSTLRGERQGLPLVVEQPRPMAAERP